MRTADPRSRIHGSVPLRRQKGRNLQWAGPLNAARFSHRIGVGSLEPYGSPATSASPSQWNIPEASRLRKIGEG